MEKEFKSLSEKIEFAIALPSGDKVLPIDNVKEFIKLLKEDLYCGCNNENCNFIDKRLMKSIDKLAGKDLI